MKKVFNLINIDNAFGNQRLLGIRVEDLIIAGVYVLAAILLRQAVSYCINKGIYILAKKKIGDYSAKQFGRLLVRPIKGLTFIFFLYLAFLQISYRFDRLHLFSTLTKVKDSDTLKRIGGFTGTEMGKLIFTIFFIFYLYLFIIELIELLTRVKEHRAKVENNRSVQQILPLVRDISKVVLWGLAIVTIVGVILNIKVGAILGGLGVGGIAIAFAAKESLENLIASFMVLVDKPFMIGDWIKVDNTEGIIEKVGFRSSRVRSFDKSIVIIPNRKLIDSNLENYSNRGIRRFMFTIGAIYGISQANIEKAIAAMKKHILSIEGVTDDPLIWLDGFGDSALNIEVIYYLTVDDKYKYYEVKHAVNFGIYNIMYQYAEGFAFPTKVEYHDDPINQVNPAEDEEELYQKGGAGGDNKPKPTAPMPPANSGDEPKGTAKD